jgi:hypothetical protein
MPKVMLTPSPPPSFPGPGGPPISIIRNYTQRPKHEFSPQARQLLFDFTTTRTLCELGQPPANNTFTTIAGQATACCQGAKED